VPDSSGRPHPAVAAVRLAVRRALTAAVDGGLSPEFVLVACSGGPDSLALAEAVAFEAPKLGIRAGAVTVDHALQAGSADQAERVRSTLIGLGLDPVVLITADVAVRGVGPGYPGPEAAARRARYTALDAARERSGAGAILLGHTMDDQAETVLLGLARGSGARSIAGMAPAHGCYLRPLLGLRRDQTTAACAALGLRPWQDPQNSDPAFARTRVRSQILPLMEELIGPGVTEALARTAYQLRCDADALDDLAASAGDRLLSGWRPVRQGGARSIQVADLADLPAAIRTRLLKRAAIAAGAPAGSVTATHIRELDALITDWHGQRWLDLPGGVRCLRRFGRLQFTGQDSSAHDSIARNSIGQRDAEV
jgi:tRNA(Ile)-lysidine synthase